MSRQKGKREAVRETWHTEGDPFSGEAGGKKFRLTGWKRIAVIVVSCVAALALAVGLWWSIFVKAPDVSDKTKPTVSNGADKETTTEPDAEDEPSAVSGRKEDYFTFLLLGEDTSSGSTDTIILASYDVASQQVNMMSIPRDTMVNVSWDIKKINSVYSSKLGMDGLKTQV